jgi:broad specificity phosphatase PhoE
MRKVLTLLLVLASFAASAQQITTFILVRHAEKGNDSASDPNLTEAGKQRALRLAALLKETKVDAVYSTPYKRTRSTVEPAAMAKGLSVETYEPAKGEAIDAMMTKHPGGTILVSGHSNTIPWTANYVSGTDQFKNFEDSDYDNVLVVSVVERGKVAKVLWLNY